MWWVLIALLLFSRKGAASAAANVNPVATPSGTTSVGSPVGSVFTLNPPITSPILTPPIFLRNPDIGTYQTVGPIQAPVERNMFTEGSSFDESAIGAPPPGEAMYIPPPPSNPLATLVQMAPPPPEPMVQPVFSTDIAMVPVTMSTGTGTATFSQAVGSNAPRMVQQ